MAKPQQVDAGPTIRLAHCGPPDALALGLQDPTVRLAATAAMVMRDNSGSAARYPHHVDNGKAALHPALLVSYVYLPGFEKNRHRYTFRDWVLDSGAYSAHNSGKEIKLQDYIDTCKRLMAADPQLTEVFALDVIQNPKQSVKNCEEMWRQGIPAIPAFHRGSNWDDLVAIARDYPKIAIGGVAMLRGRDKMKWAEQVFARVWPKRIHGFAYGSAAASLELPFHSVDATSWEIGPCRFGNWKSYGQMSVRGSTQNLRKEVEWYLELERKARWRWRREMAELAALDPAPTVRLAVVTHGPRVDDALNPARKAETNAAGKV